MTHFLASVQKQPGSNIFMPEQILYEALGTYTGQTFSAAMGPLWSASGVSEVSVGVQSIITLKSSQSMKEVKGC